MAVVYRDDRRVADFDGHRLVVTHNRTGRVGVCPSLTGPDYAAFLRMWLPGVDRHRLRDRLDALTEPAA